jgi:hypothetical protein
MGKIVVTQFLRNINGHKLSIVIIIFSAIIWSGFHRHSASITMAEADRSLHDIEAFLARELPKGRSPDPSNIVDGQLVNSRSYESG